jgi:hypothetical protein
MGAIAKRDFFISYNQADADIAQWIAWTLEDNDYTVVIEAWDFRAGGNFVVEMDKGLVQCERMIVVMSPHYLSANYTVSEWAEKFSNDPQGIRRAVVPVVVEPCEPSGLLQQLIRIEIFGLERDAAKKELLAKLAPGRAKPATEPPFPERIARHETPRKSTAGPAALEWLPIQSPPTPRWRGASERVGYDSPTLELHTLCIDAAALESRRLRALPDSLASVARLAGLFEHSEGLQTIASEGSAGIRSIERQGEKGVIVYRDREIASWAPLPKAFMGSVFDESDVASRLAAMIGLHIKTGLMECDQIAIGVSVEPVSTLMVGTAADLMHRNSAQFLFMMNADSSARIEPVGAVSLAALTSHTDGVADELTARLALRIGSLR